MVNIVTQILHIIATVLRNTNEGWMLGRVAYMLTAVLIGIVLMADTVLLQHLAFLSNHITRKLVNGIRVAIVCSTLITISSYVFYVYSIKSLDARLYRIAITINFACNCFFAIFSIGYDSGQVLFLGISILLRAKEKQRLARFRITKKLVSFYCIYFLLGWTACVGFIVYGLDRDNNTLWIRLPTIVTGFEAFLLGLILKELHLLTNAKSCKRVSIKNQNEQMPNNVVEKGPIATRDKNDTEEMAVPNLPDTEIL
jgi:hypothetical protein